jgi:hypothetical protein
LHFAEVIFYGINDVGIDLVLQYNSIWGILKADLCVNENMIRKVKNESGVV